MTLYKKLFENIVGKGENAGNYFFPTMFSTFHKTNFNFLVLYIFCHLQILPIWTSLKFCRLETKQDIT